MECLICLDEIRELELFQSECGHSFHEKCITMEFAEQCNTFYSKYLCCPYCRNVLNTPDVMKKKDKITSIHGLPDNISIKKSWAFLEESFNCQNCCVITKQKNQCKKKKIKANNLLKTQDLNPLDEDTLLYVTSFKFIEDSLCNYHLKNINKIKYFHHPYFKWVMYMYHN